MARGSSQGSPCAIKSPPHTEPRGRGSWRQDGAACNILWARLGGLQLPHVSGDPQASRSHGHPSVHRTAWGPEKQVTGEEAEHRAGAFWSPARCMLQRPQGPIPPRVTVTSCLSILYPSTTPHERRRAEETASSPRSRVSTGPFLVSGRRTTRPGHFSQELTARYTGGGPRAGFPALLPVQGLYTPPSP